MKEVKASPLFFVFDRNILADKNNNPADQRFFLPFTQTLQREENTQWAITREEKLPDSLIAAVVKMSDDVEITWDHSEQTLSPEEHAKIVLDVLLEAYAQRSKEHDEDNLFPDTLVGEAIRSEKHGLTVTYRENATFQFMVGSTQITIQITTLLEKMLNYRLFFILQALDNAKLRPILSSEFRQQTGIRSIVAPKEYAPISAHNVLFIDARDVASFIDDGKQDEWDVHNFIGFAEMAWWKSPNQKRKQTPLCAFLEKHIGGIQKEVRASTPWESITHHDLDSLKVERIESLIDKALIKLYEAVNDGRDLSKINLRELSHLLDHFRFSWMSLRHTMLEQNIHKNMIRIADAYIRKGIYNKEFGEFLAFRLLRDESHPQEMQKLISDMMKMGPNKDHKTVSVALTEYQRKFHVRPENFTQPGFTIVGAVFGALKNSSLGRFFTPVMRRATDLRVSPIATRYSSTPAAAQPLPALLPPVSFDDRMETVLVAETVETPPRSFNWGVVVPDLSTCAADVIESLRTNILTTLHAWLNNGEDLTHLTLSQFIPLFDYSRFSLFRRSVQIVKANDLLLEIADKYISNGIYNKEIADFLVLRLCHDWKRPEIQQKVAAIANIKPAGQITISPTHFRIAYMAQYQCEFFTNPKSKMLRRIKQDPVAFDKTDISAIVTDENGRSKEVLAKLGQRA